MTLQRRSGGPVDRLPLAAGAVAGAAAYALGYVLTYLLVAIDADLDPDDPFVAVGTVYYNAQFVDTVFAASAGDLSTSESVNLLRETSTQLPEAAYFAVPVVVLVVAGFTAVRSGGGASAPIEGAIGGALLAVGTVPLAIAGVYVFEASGSVFGVQSSAAPELVGGVVLVGIAYPVVFGGLGGVLAALSENR